MLFLNVFLLGAALKDKGNEAFARGDYATAVQFYTDGLAELRDMKPLYTNRAQVRKTSYLLCCLPVKEPLPPALTRKNSLLKSSRTIFINLFAGLHQAGQVPGSC